MNTWTSKPAFAVLALSALAGCDTGPAAGLLGGLTRAAAPKAQALKQAPMAAGAITLVPPGGYCIDQRSLTPSFALMARCDVLHPGEVGRGMPLGVITASISDATDSIPTPDQTAAAHGLGNISETSTSDNSVVFRATGDAPIKGMSATHWRATTQIDTQLLGLAFYQPEKASDGSLSGAEILQELISNTTAANN